MRCTKTFSAVMKLIGVVKIMQAFESLSNYLNRSVADKVITAEVAQVILAITAATQKISALVSRGLLAGALGATRGDNTDGDVQKELDIVANDIIIEALENRPVAWLVSEELDQPKSMNPEASLIVAIDPLDGS